MIEICNTHILFSEMNVLKRRFREAKGFVSAKGNVCFAKNMD